MIIFIQNENLKYRINSSVKKLRTRNLEILKYLLLADFLSAVSLFRGPGIYTKIHYLRFYEEIWVKNGKKMTVFFSIQCSLYTVYKVLLGVLYSR